MEIDDDIDKDSVLTEETDKSDDSLVESYVLEAVLNDLDADNKLYYEALIYVAGLDQETVSIGMIQRKFRLGFNRAASIMDRLAEDGIVGFTEGVRGRRILVSDRDLPEKIHKILENQERESRNPEQRPMEAKPTISEPFARNAKDYSKPPTYLLRNYYGMEPEIQKDETELEKLITTMGSFGIHVTYAGTQSSSVCTIYSVIPEAGTKVSKIKGIKADLELSLGKQVEIEIGNTPGTLNVRVPNPDRGIVGIRKLIDDPMFSNGSLKIPVAAGIDDKGDPLFIDITKTPHLLIAGTTGSGKSVFINDIVISVLYSCSPNEVQMILIDPKVVELSRYNLVPHLIEPVVTDSSMAISVLDNAEKTNY